VKRGGRISSLCRAARDPVF